MNYIYDLVLNFSEGDNYLEFYEWKKLDEIINVIKIPVFKINRFQMDDIINKKIVFFDEILEKVKNKTMVENSNFIDYCFLVTDLSKVIALKCDSLGNVIGRSSLLLDEEESVIDEVIDYPEVVFKYTVVGEYKKNNFLTREEKIIQKKLLNELKCLYKNKDYDEIKYLYEELYDDLDNVHEGYKFLMDDIKNNYSSKYNKLYEIIRLT